MKIRAKHRRAAKAIGKTGASYVKAGKAAGLTSRRGRAGITVAEWMKDPDFRQLVAKYAEEAMSGEEWEARNALMARGLLPSRYEWDGEGHLVKAVCEAGDALERQGKALGKFKDGAGQTPPGAGALGAFLGVEPDKLAALAEAAAAVLRSVPDGA